MTTVLIADDQPLQRFGFRMLLESQDDMTVLGEAANGSEAIRLHRGHPPHHRLRRPHPRPDPHDLRPRRVRLRRPPRRRLRLPRQGRSAGRTPVGHPRGGDGRRGGRPEPDPPTPRGVRPPSPEAKPGRQPGANGQSTVKTHVGRILAKTASRDRIQAVILAYDTGLVMPS